jgi:hypothetical protein
VPADGFSVRWTRSLHFDEGAYTLYAEADDGVRVYVDGQRLIDQWHDSDGSLYTAEVYLTPGTHTVTVEYYDNQHGALIRFWWAKR